jgi:hypothetical protein
VEDVVTFPGRMYAFVNFREAADAAQAAQAVQVESGVCGLLACIVWCFSVLNFLVSQLHSNATTTAVVVCRAATLLLPCFT